MRNQRNGDASHGPSNVKAISFASTPSSVSDSMDSLLGNASVPRKRNTSRHRFEHDARGSQHLLPGDSSATSNSSEVNGDTMEKGYGGEYRRWATPTSLKPRILNRWSTYGAAAFCVVFALFTAIVIVSRGIWETTHDGVSGQCGSMFASDEIMALKPSSTLENLKNGAVASDQGICSEIGVSMLRDYGGHAVDAAVATALCVGVVNPVSSGLGGGTFILIHADSPKTTGLPPFHDKRVDGPEIRKNGMVTEVIDAREIAPAASTSEMFVNADEHASVFGGLASAIPGELRGLELAHARYGRLPWSTVVAPAMKLARDGVPVSVHLATEIKKIVARAEKFSDYPDGLRKLISKDGTWINPLKEGGTLRNPALAQTLRAVMENGADALYTGDLAAKWAADIHAAEGIITAEDIEGYRPTLRSPMVAEDVGGFTLVGAPPPGTGGVVIAGALRFLSGYKAPFATSSDTLSVHRMVEACRHGYALRMSLSDPEYNTETTMAVVNDLTKGTFMDSLREMTKDDTTLRLSQYGGKWAQLKDTEGQAEAYDAQEGDRRLLAEADEFELIDLIGDELDDFLTSSADRPTTRRLARPFGYLEDFGTSHISVVDKEGNAVALTTSINSKFGSGVFSESTGILMNNQMDDFGTPSKTSFYGVRPTESNYVKPGKKPLSSMSPLLLFRRHEGAVEGEWGDLYLVIGGSGGPKIITAVLQVILNFVFRGMPLFEAMAYPRVHNQLLYQDAHVTTVEHGQLVEGPLISVSNRTRSALANRGHKLLELDYMGTVQAVAVDPETGELSAVCDIRKGGTPAGY